MSGCEIMKCKWWRGTSQSCAEPIGVCIYSQDAALAALRAEVADYKTLCQGHVLAEKQWKAEVERLQEVVRWERGAKEEAYELIEEQGKLRARCEAAEGELAELQGKRNTAYSYIEDVLIGSPYEWAGKRLLEMIGDKK